MHPKNLLELFKNSVDQWGEKPCWYYKEGGSWQAISWSDAYAKVLDLAGALKKLGVSKGDPVSIFSNVRYEWSLADFAILSCGAITVPIYQSSLPEQASYILKNAEVKVAFLEDAQQLKKINQVRSDLPDLKKIILFNDKGVRRSKEGIYNLEEVMILGEGRGEKIFKEMKEDLNYETVATYVYTSGTTGQPKGAILTHGNFISEMLAFEPVLRTEEGTKGLLFLPLAHIFARAFQFAQIYYGIVQYYAESIDKLLDNIAEVGPNIVPSVPRIFEKIHTKVMQGLENAPAKKKRIFDWALKIGMKRHLYLQKNRSVPLILKLKWLVAFRLVFSKLHQKMGNNIDFFVSGGAPLAREIAEFFHAAGLLVLEGYGLTETSAALTCNVLTTYKLGTVGKPLPGVELKIASDGEILARGGLIFKGYYKRPEATREVIDSEGWFHTGDIGEFDSEGFLRITDRKKDIIVTAAGKNIAPQNIENLIKMDPLISQVMVHGDKRKYLTALITLDKDEIVSYAKTNRIPSENYSELIKNEKIYQLIKTRIDEMNSKLARYETVKKFAILDSDFSVETGELTPTLKVKRRFTSDKYKEILDSFYQD